MMVGRWCDGGEVVRWWGGGGEVVMVGRWG